jgi:hypothetical protein
MNQSVNSREQFHSTHYGVLRQNGLALAEPGILPDVLRQSPWVLHASSAGFRPLESLGRLASTTKLPSRPLFAENGSVSHSPHGALMQDRRRRNAQVCHYLVYRVNTTADHLSSSNQVTLIRR